MSNLPFGLDAVADILAIAVLKVMTISQTIVISPEKFDFKYEHVLDTSDFPSARDIGCDPFGKVELDGQAAVTLTKSQEGELLKCNFSSSGAITELSGTTPSAKLRMVQTTPSRYRFVIKVDLSQYVPKGPTKELIEKDPSYRSRNIYNVNFSAPSILNTNGLLSDSGDNVRWSLSTEEALSASQELFVEFSVDGSGKGFIEGLLSAVSSFFKDFVAGIGYLITLILRLLRFLFIPQ